MAFDKIPEVAADGEPTFGEVGILLNANFEKTLELFPQRNATGTLNEADLPPKSQAELIEDVFGGLDGYDLASTVTLKIVIKDGKVQFVPDTGGTASSSAPTALARLKSSSHPDFVQGEVTIQSYENAVDLYGVYTAANPVAFRWHLLSKPAGSTAVLHGHGPGTPDIRDVQNTYLISMDVAGVYELEFIVTDTVTGQTARGTLRITKI